MPHLAAQVFDGRSVDRLALESEGSGVAAGDKRLGGSGVERQHQKVFFQSLDFPERPFASWRFQLEHFAGESNQRQLGVGVAQIDHHPLLAQVELLD